MGMAPIRERTKAGLSAARARGRLGGRKPKMDVSKIASAKTLLESGMTGQDIVNRLGVSRATLYRSIAIAPTNDNGTKSRAS